MNSKLLKDASLTQGLLVLSVFFSPIFYKASCMRLHLKLVN